MWGNWQTWVPRVKVLPLFSILLLTPHHLLFVFLMFLPKIAFNSGIVKRHTMSALLCSDKQSDLRRWHVVSCSARWDQDVPQPIRKYEQDYDGSLTSPFPWCNSSVGSKPIFMACFKNVFLLSWPSGGSRAKKAANVGISHPQIALASSIFVLWLGVSSFDQTSPLDILYLCFVDHFYWEQIISFSWKFVMGLRFFFS